MFKKLMAVTVITLISTSTLFSTTLNASTEFVEQSEQEKYQNVDTYSSNIACNSARDFNKGSIYYCNYVGHGVVTGTIFNKEKSNLYGPANNGGKVNVWIDDCGLANGGGICRTVAKSEGTFLPEGYSESVKYTHGTNSENESYRTGGKYVTATTSDNKVKSSLD